MTATNDRLAYLISNSQVVIYSAEPWGDHATTFISNNVQEWLGYEPHEFIDDARFWNDHVHPDDAPGVLDVLRYLPENGYSSLDYRFRRRDGSYRWIHNDLKVSRDANGNPIELIGFLMDITERKAREIALQESEMKYHGIFEATNDIIVLLDKDGNILDINNRAELLLGYPQPELRQMNTFEHLCAAEEHVLMRQVIDDSMAGRTQEYSVHWKTKDDRTLHFEVTSAPRFSPDGEFISTVCCMRDVTEHKWTGIRLKTSEELHQLVLRTISDTVLITNDTGEFIYICPNVDNIFGYSAEEVKALSNIVYLLGPDLIEPLDWGHSDEIENIEYKITDKSRAVHRLLINIKRISIGKGTRLYTCRDITERKLLEDARQRSDELFSRIFESVPASLGIISFATHRIMNVNDYTLRLTGYQLSEVVGQRVPEAPFWTQSSQWDQMLEPVQEAGVSLGYDMEWRAKSGDILNMLGSTVQIELNGELYLLGIAVDVTERKQAEQAVQRSEEMFSKIFRAVPAAIFIATNDEGRVLRINDYMLTMIGYEQWELAQGKTMDIWISQDIYRKLVRSVVENGGIYGVETQWHTRSGEVIDMMISAEPIEVDGQICILGIGLDVTERKRSEQGRFEAEQLRLQVYKEREVLELKEKFISTMSHEFRTPLAVIQSSKETLLHYFDRLTPEKRLEKLHNIDEQVRYVMSLLDEVLMIGAARSGKLQFNPVALDLPAFCQRLFEQIQITDIHHHQFNFDTDGQITEISGDTNLLQHVLVNLLSNAIKYSPDGGEIRLQVLREADEAVIRVSDQGIGTPEENIKYLFEPFFRASNTNSIKGTGLGLAIVKESVEAHGGTIVCESAAGKGTTFSVRLPAPKEILKSR